MSNKIDIFILLFIAYHLLRGYAAGFSRSLFLSLRFVGVAVATWYITANHLTDLMSQSWIRIYVQWLSKLLEGFISPFIYRALDLERKILIVSLFLLITIVINLVFEVIQSQIKKSSIKTMDKNLGLLFGGVKAVLYLMGIVVLLDPMIQRFMGMAGKDALSTSALLKYFYRYNLFFDIFG